MDQMKDRKYWGTKITVKYGKNHTYTGVLYTKDRKFAEFMKRVCDNSDLRTTIEPFYKPKK